MGHGLRFLAVLPLLFAGCDGRADAIDPFPVPVEMSTGAVVLSVRTGADAPVTAVIDTLSPITIIDTCAATSAPALATHRQLDLTLLSRAQSGRDAAPDDEELLIPRARFPSVEVYDVHPCAASDDSCTRPDACRVGVGGASVPVAAVLGGDLLSRGALRLDFPSSTVRFFPSIAGDAQARGQSCDAVFDAVFFGGGTLHIAETEVAYSGHRVAVGACLGYFTDYSGAETSCQRDDGSVSPLPCELDDPRKRGVNAAFVLSTALRTTILSASTYDRFREFSCQRERTRLKSECAVMCTAACESYIASCPDARCDKACCAADPCSEDPDSADPCADDFAGVCASCLSSPIDCCLLPTFAQLLADDTTLTTIELPSGPMRARTAEIDRIALVGEVSANRDPCKELWANHYMSTDACRLDAPTPLRGRSCPCNLDSAPADTATPFCKAGAAIELDRSITVAVIPDTEPMIQALRGELRPALPEVDGILGTDAVRDLTLDVDYPHGRLLARCSGDRESCIARPQVRSRQESGGGDIRHCLPADGD